MTKLADWARRIRAAEGQQALLDIADEMDAVPLSDADIDQIVEGIVEFIVGPDPDEDLLPIWQPYIDKLNALKT